MVKFGSEPESLLSKNVHFLLDYHEQEENIVIKNDKKKIKNFYKLEHVSGRYAKAMMIR